MNFYKINNSQKTPGDEHVISYMRLRLFIGLIGLALPFGLPLGVYLFDSGADAFQWSISHYYYTKMHILFVGLLCVLGAFLFTYRGKFYYENILSTLAGLLAFFVAIFPTPYEGYLPVHGIPFINLQPVKDFVGPTHFISATILFICFALISGFYFTKEDDSKNNMLLKKRRNKIYVACAIFIVLSLVLAGLALINAISFQSFWPWLNDHSTYFFEATALLSFGISWIVKGTYMWSHEGFFNKLIYNIIIRFIR
jgi:hypothetical protein